MCALFKESCADDGDRLWLPTDPYSANMTLTRAQAQWDWSDEFTAKMLRIKRKWTRLTGPEKQAVRLLAPVIQRQTLKPSTLEWF